MYVLAITGGIGSGKTTAAHLFGALGATVIELDDLAKKLTAAGGPLAADVIAAFGPEVAATDGGVDTKALADRAFAGPDEARRLDRIVHPGVYAAAAGAIDMLGEMPEPPSVVVIDIPLLVEAPEFFDLLDGVLAVSADEDTRVERLLERGMSEDDIRARLALQVSDAERRDIADWTVENDVDKVTFESLLVSWWDQEMADRDA